MNNIDYGKRITDEYRKQTLEYGRKTFNLNDDIVYQISMMSYDKYNDKIATMYDNTDVYSYSEIEDEKRAEIEYELQESHRAIEYLQLLLTIKNLEQRKMNNSEKLYMKDFNGEKYLV